jgi:hypothetical protein
MAALMDSSVMVGPLSIEMESTSAPKYFGFIFLICLVLDSNPFESSKLMSLDSGDRWEETRGVQVQAKGIGQSQARVGWFRKGCHSPQSLQCDWMAPGGLELEGVPGSGWRRGG